LLDKQAASAEPIPEPTPAPARGPRDLPPVRPWLARRTDPPADVAPIVPVDLGGTALDPARPWLEPSSAEQEQRRVEAERQLAAARARESEAAAQAAAAAQAVRAASPEHQEATPEEAERLRVLLEERAAEARRREFAEQRLLAAEAEARAAQARTEPPPGRTEVEPGIAAPDVGDPTAAAATVAVETATEPGVKPPPRHAAPLRSHARAAEQASEAAAAASLVAPPAAPGAAAPPPAAPPPAAPPDAAPAAAARRGPRTRTLVSLGLLAAAVIVVTVLLRTFVVGSYWIPSASMEPTLHGCPGCNDDHVLVNKLSYKMHGFKRGDVVVFTKPANVAVPEKVLIKRVIGLPGDLLTDRNGSVFVNGLQLTEPYVNPLCKHGTTGLPAHGARVPAGKLYVMGDNRCDSKDSRAFGPIPESSVQGRAFVIIWPYGRMHYL
jgi:signal peptidase I